MTGAPRPALAVDPLVEEASARAFSDLAGRERRALLQSVVDLGFADALPAIDARAEGTDARAHWADAASIIRSQARAAAPIDMALLLATGDRAASIAYDPAVYSCGAASVPADRAVAAALALGRCLQISAAMQAALDLTLRYAQDRKQFGRALAQFQAIQHSLALAAEEVAACSALTDLALARMVREGPAGATLASLLDSAALVASRAVDVVYDICHQVHGAIGFTREYALHRHSLDLLRWREHLLQLRGGELGCAERLGDAAFRAQGVWRAVTAMMHG